MKRNLLVLGVIWGGLQATELHAQLSKEEAARITEVCGCLPRTDPGFIDEAFAQLVVDSLASMVGERINDVLAVKCTSNAQALLCGEAKYILYNNALLESMKVGAPWAERFIMAHEIAHHLHKHTQKQNVFSDDRLPSILVETKEGRERIYGYRVKTKTRDGAVVRDTVKFEKKDLVNAINFYHHLRELQADATATWMLYQREITLTELNAIWVQYAQKKGANTLSWSPQHPSIELRKRHTAMLWNTLHEDNRPQSPSQEPGKYIRKTALDLSKQSIGDYLFKRSDNFGSEDSSSLALDEQRLWEYVSRRHGYTLELDIGTVLTAWSKSPTLAQYPALPAQWAPYNGFVGIRFTQINWRTPQWWHMSMGYKTLGFITYDEQNNLKMGIEQFRWQGLYFSPQVLLTTVSGKYQFAPIRQGMYVSLGGTLDVPLRVSYQNFLVGTAKTDLTSAASISPLVEVGVVQLSRDPRKINARLGLTYQWQRIALDPDAQRYIRVPQLGLRLTAQICQL